MIAHIHQPKERRPVPPLVRARQMVAETLFSNERLRQSRRKMPRRILAIGLLAFLAVGIVAIYLWR